MQLDLKSYAQTVRVTDGAWATQLQAAGLPAGAPPELWNVQNPGPVEAVARSYVQGGSDVILTNSFGANRLALGPHHASTPAAQLAQAASAISCKATAKTDVRVFGSIGPTGKIVMMGDVPPEQFTAAFSEAASALAAGGVDAIVLETFNELTEAELALKAVKAAVDDLPVVVCMTFASGPEGTATMMGNTPGDLAAMSAANGADAVGANCGAGPDNYIKVARLLRAATALPIWIKPNAGLPELGPDGKTIFRMGPEQFAARVPDLIAAGANFIGGCCGTTPDHIRAIRAAVDAASG